MVVTVLRRLDAPPDPGLTCRGAQNAAIFSVTCSQGIPLVVACASIRLRSRIPCGTGAGRLESTSSGEEDTVIPRQRVDKR